jgi:hypothetical protein
VLRTVGDARGYILTLPKTRKSRAHWKRASLLLQEEVGAAALTLQVQVALVMDGKLDNTFERMSTARRWRQAYKQEEEEDWKWSSSWWHWLLLGSSAALLHFLPIPRWRQRRRRRSKAALEAFGCTGGKMEKEDEDATLPYEVDDAKCKSGEYDIKLDKNFNVIIMLRDWTPVCGRWPTATTKPTREAAMTAFAKSWRRE